MSKENLETSLTSPSDRDPDKKKYTIKQLPPLSEEGASNAMEELNLTGFVDRFEKVERSYADPTIMNQKISLHSFIPSKNAKPDENGIFGMLKVRGTFATEDEANERAEYLIRNVDSYHSIFHGFVGRPFPITVTSDFSKEVERVELQKKTTEIISSDIKEKKRKERQDIEDVKEREQNLQEEVDRESNDPFEVYITLNVKKAQLVWTYKETQKKMDQMKESIIKTRKEIEELDEENNEFSEKYLDKYMQAREKSGIKDEDDESFMKYLCKDVEEDLAF
jgi:hypothetical protein